MPYKCEFCGKKYDKRKFYTEAVPNEGCSSITIGDVSLYIDDADYCSLQCFVSEILSHFNKEPK